MAVTLGVHGPVPTVEPRPRRPRPRKGSRSGRQDAGRKKGTEQHSGEAVHGNLLVEMGLLLRQRGTKDPVPSYLKREGIQGAGHLSSQPEDEQLALSVELHFRLSGVGRGVDFTSAILPGEDRAEQ